MSINQYISEAFVGKDMLAGDLLLELVQHHVLEGDSAGSSPCTRSRG